MNKKSILELCLSPDLGGLELYVKSCVEVFDKEFNVISVLNDSSKLEKYFIEEKYKYFKIKRKSSFSLSAAFKLAKIIDKNAVDIIHLHWTKDIPIAVFAIKISKKKPKIVQTRHMTMTRFKNDFYHRFLYKNIDTIICVTQELSKQINKFISNDIRPNVEVLYLGAKNHKEKTLEEIKSFRDKLDVNEAMMIGLLGRINEFKGQYLLIEAMKNLKDLNIKAFIVGSAMSEEYLKSLKEKVNEFNLNENVIFLGFTKEANKFMQACDLVLMTSKNETFGLVTIEAMKSGTCVIGSNSGGVLEIIEDNKTGLLFQSGDSFSLTSKIKKMYEDKELRKKLALNGQKKANECFDNEIQFDKLINIFNKL